MRVGTRSAALSACWPASDLDNQAPFTTGEIDVVAADRLLAGKLETAKSAIASASHKTHSARGAATPQRTGPESRFGVRSPHADCPSPRPSPRSRGEGEITAPCARSSPGCR